MSIAERIAKAHQGAGRATRPKHASKHRAFCHSHASPRRQVRPTNYVPCIGGSTLLEVDPIEGGSASDYDYVDGDPINQFDLQGTFSFKKFVRRVKKIGRSVSKIGSLCSVVPGAVGMACGGLAAAGYAINGDWKHAAIAGAGVALGGTGGVILREFRAGAAAAGYGGGAMWAMRGVVNAPRVALWGSTTNFRLGHARSRRRLTGRVCRGVGFGPEMTPGGKC